MTSVLSTRESPKFAADPELQARAHGLARWAVHDVATWRGRPDARPIADALEREAVQVLSSVSLSVAFPNRCAENRRRALESLVHARAALARARDHGFVSASRAQHALDELDTIERALGATEQRDAAAEGPAKPAAPDAPRAD